MPREFTRKQRVSDQLKRELGDLITTKVKDPRVRLAAVTEVDVSPDLKQARVYVGTFDLTGKDNAPDEIVAGLRAASGFLKRELGKRLRMRVIPELRFIEDATERKAQRLDRVIADAVAEDQKHGPGPDDAEGTTPNLTGSQAFQDTDERGTT